MSLALNALAPVFLPTIAALALQAPQQATPQNAPAKPAPAVTTPTPSAQATGATTATQPDTVEAWIPANAVAVVRLSSLDTATSMATTLARIGDENARLPDVLEMLGGAVGLQAPWELVDRKRPMVLAAALSDTRPPAALTLIVNSTDPAKLIAAEGLQASGWSSARHGDVVVLSNDPNERALAADAPLRVGLEKHTIAVRVDVEEIMAQYGDLFRQGFDSAAAQEIASASEDGQRALMQSMFDGVTDAIDSLETFGIALDAAENRTRLSFEITSMEGSPLVDVMRVDTDGLAALTRVIESDAPIAFAWAMDMSAMCKMLEPLTQMAAQKAVDAAKKAEAEAAASMMRMATEAYASMGPLMAGGLRFDESGMSMVYGLKPKDPTQFVDKMLGMLREPIFHMKVTGPVDSKIGDKAVKSLVVTYADAAGDDKTPGMVDIGSGSQAARAAIDESMRKLFGTDGVPLTLVPHETSLFVAMGVPATVEGLIARLSSKATSTSTAGADVLRALGTMNPGYAVRFDVGAFVAGVNGLSKRMGESAKPLSDAELAAFRSFPIVHMVGGLEQRTWRFVLETDVAKLATSVRAIQTAQAQKYSNKLVRCKLDIIAIESALKEYAMNNSGKYPDSLQALVVPDENGSRFLNVERVPRDPWDREYLFLPPTPGNPEPIVRTLGADGVVGGTDENADVDNVTIANGDHR